MTAGTGQWWGGEGKMRMADDARGPGGGHHNERGGRTMGNVETM